MVIIYGVVVGMVFAQASVLLHLDVAGSALVGGSIGMLFCLLVDKIGKSASPNKPKHDAQGKAKRQAREKALVADYVAPAQPTIKRRREVSRLSVPDGYVPLEMTRTETRTPDMIKTETQIKTYVDSNNLPTQGNRIKIITEY